MCSQEIMIHRGKGLTVGPDPMDSLFSLSSSSLLVQIMPYPLCPPPAAEPHWTKTDNPHQRQSTESRSRTGDCGVARANEWWTTMKERRGGSKGVGPGDTVFASCAFGFMMHLWSPGLRPLSGRKMKKMEKVTNLQHLLWWFKNTTMIFVLSL